MTSTWERELNRLERDVDAASSLLDAGEVPPAERWFPPEDMGPLPEQLRPRAEQLLRSLDVVSRRAAERREGLGRELNELHRRRDAAHAYNVSGVQDGGSTTTT